MAKHRCPICGAGHKEALQHCRLCGAEMLDPTMVPASMKIKPSGDAHKYQPRSVMPFVLGGVALVLALGIGAVVFGIVDTGNELRGVTARIIPSDEPDGWITFEDANVTFAADFPGEPEVNAAATEPVSQRGSATAFEREVADGLSVRVLLVEGAGLDTDDPYPALIEIAEAMASERGASLQRAPTQGSHGGVPAIDFVLTGINVDGVPIRVYVRIILLEGGDALVVSTESSQNDPPQHGRIVSSVVLDPAATAAS